jgi:hypothetical protein
MKILRRPKSLFIATMLFASSTLALAGDDEKYRRDESSVEQNESSGPLLLAGVDYCYAGSLVDPNTGEVVELYVPCPEDGFEQNIDFA